MVLRSPPSTYCVRDRGPWPLGRPSGYATEGRTCIFVYLTSAAGNGHHGNDFWQTLSDFLRPWNDSVMDGARRKSPPGYENPGLNFVSSASISASNGTRLPGMGVVLSWLERLKLRALTYLSSQQGRVFHLSADAILLEPGMCCHLNEALRRLWSYAKCRRFPTVIRHCLYDIYIIYVPSSEQVYPSQVLPSQVVCEFVALRVSTYFTPVTHIYATSTVVPSAG